MSTSSTNMPVVTVPGLLGSEYRLPVKRSNTNDPTTGAVVFELYSATDFRKQCVVFSVTDIETWPEPQAPLADQNCPAGDKVAVEPLHTESLCVAVTTVARTALSFFVCHDSVRVGRDVGDSDSGQICSVSLRAPHSLASLELENAYLWASMMRVLNPHYARASDIRTSAYHRAVIPAH